MNHEIKTIEDICSFEYGKSLPKKERIKGPYPVMGSNGITGFHNKFLIKGPAIIIGRKGSSGEVVWEDRDCFPIDTTYYVKLKDEQVRLKFLYFVLKKLELKSLSGGTGIPGLNRNDAYKINISMPSIEEQDSLLSEIEEQQKGVDACKKLIEIYEKKIKEKIDEVWGKK